MTDHAGKQNTPAPDRRRATAASALVWLLCILYIVYFSWLSVRAHQAFQTNAMDLGYTSQAVWNTLHGRILEFSTYQGAKIDLPLDQFRRTDILLSYHVELLLIPISLLYAVYAHPATLLVFQSIVLGLGALPAFWLARRHLKSEAAGLVFALAYLLAPALQGANISDFHAVSLTAPLLLLAFDLMDRRRYGAFIAVALVAMSAKEDIPLLVVMLGLYLVFVHKQPRIGLATVLMGLGWFLICSRVILPYFSGLSVSPFFARLAIFAPTARETVARAVADPGLIMQWLARPESLTYIGGLLATAGFMSLFSPAVLVLAAPVAAVNIFSTWSWSYSEGAHYSASLLPFIIVAAIYGVRNLADAASGRMHLPREGIVALLAAVVLAFSLYHQYQIGVLPFARSFHPPQITAHHRAAQALIESIPADAAVSTQSSLYPHLSLRTKAYLFPAVNDAEYILVDVTTPPYPSNLAEVAAKVQSVLWSGQFRLLQATDGLLLFRREANAEIRVSLPDSFYSFALAGEGTVGHPLPARFGDSLELVGYDYALYTTVSANDLPAAVTTYWRIAKPLDEAYRFHLYFTRPDGAIVGQYSEETATTLWYNPWSWQVGQVVRVDTPMLPIGRLHDVLLAVSVNRAGGQSTQESLRPVVDDSTLLVGDGSLLKLFSFP